MVYFHIFSSILSLGVNVICQIWYCRLVKKASLLKSTFFGFFCGVLTLLCLEVFYAKQSAISGTQSLPSVFTNFISYVALGYCYFHFINLGETARRIRLLQELAEVKSGLSTQEILMRYNAKEIIENRLGRLLKNKQIIFVNNRYYIEKPTMFFASRVIIFLKMFILGKKSELS